VILGGVCLKSVNAKDLRDKTCYYLQKKMVCNIITGTHLHQHVLGHKADTSNEFSAGQAGESIDAFDLSANWSTSSLENIQCFFH